jgi:hypothetical protein
MVAVNRKRMLESVARRRNCLTCEERCSARPRGLEEVQA